MKKSILYFIQGPVATPEESADAERVEQETGVRVQLRNAQWATPGDDDFRNFVDVIGSVPSFYNIDIVEEKEETSQEDVDASLDEYMKTSATAASSSVESQEKVAGKVEEKTVLEEAAEKPPVAVSPLKKKRGRPAKVESTEKE